MGYIENDGETETLHLRYSPIIDNEVLIAKGCTPLGKHDMTVTRLHNFTGGKLHGFGRKELAFLDVDRFPGAGSGHKQVGLPAQKGGNTSTYSAAMAASSAV